MSYEQDFDEIAKPKRSTFLTVLCILSFVGSSYGILSSAGSFAMFRNGTMQNLKQNQERAIEQMKESKSRKNNFALKVMENSTYMMDPEKMKMSNIFNIIGALLTLTGALLMFRLNVVGYIIYIIGCLIPIGAMLYIYGANNFITTVSVSVVGFFSLIFIVLYGMCVKEMRPSKNIA